MLLILFAYKFRKISLIFKILLVLDDEAYKYDFLVFLFFVGLVPFLKNLDISMTSLGVFTVIGKSNFTKLTGLLVDLLLLEVVFISCIFGVNLDARIKVNHLIVSIPR